MEMNPTYYLSYASWAFFSALQRSTFTPPHNHVHWTETPTSHLYAADLPGLRKEEIRVEVEDSKYMVIRTELCSTGTGTEEEEAERVRQRSFNRKFRLPVRVDVEGITARYEDGVLTVTVPRLLRRAQINCAGLDEAVKSVARAA